MVERHYAQLYWGPNPVEHGAPPGTLASDEERGVAGRNWVEPWVGELWEEWDLNAALTIVGLTVKPVDPDALPGPARALLPEWADDWTDRRRAAQDAADAKR